MPKTSNLTRDTSEPLIVALFVLTGAAARLIWTAAGDHLRTLNNESHNIAASLARNGQFADAFYPGSGPSAHIGMLTPLPSSLAYMIFGIDTPAAEWALAVYATAIVSITFWLSWKLACKIGAPLPARICAVALATLVPLQFGLETREGRAWEVNLAALGLIWILNRLIDESETTPALSKSVAFTAVITAILFILSPPAGLAGFAAVGLFEFVNFSYCRLLTRLGVFLLVLLGVSGLWADRNLNALSDPVPLRDNFGLELAIANYSGAVSPLDEKRQFLQRISDIHPVSLGLGLAAMKTSGGEAQYYRKLEAGAKTWIGQHPTKFASLTLKHIRQYFFPPSWFWGTFGGGGQSIAIRLFITWSLAAAGLITLAYLATSQASYMYILVATVTTSLPYALVQPTLRYRYLISTLLIFAASDGVFRSCRSARNTIRNTVRSRQFRQS